MYRCLQVFLDLTNDCCNRDELVIDDARTWKLPTTPLGRISGIAGLLPLWRLHERAVRPSTGVISADDPSLLATAMGADSSDSGDDRELLSPLEGLAAMSWPRRPALNRARWW